MVGFGATGVVMVQGQLVMVRVVGLVTVSAFPLVSDWHHRYNLLMLGNVQVLLFMVTCVGAGQ